MKWVKLRFDLYQEDLYHFCLLCGRLFVGGERYFWSQEAEATCCSEECCRKYEEDQ